MRAGKLTSIVFIRHRNKSGHEISGYIDYAHRLKTDDFQAYFERRRKLLPRATDLSFYNYDTGTSTSNSTANFQVIADGSHVSQLEIGSGGRHPASQSRGVADPFRLLAPSRTSAGIALQKQA